MGQSMVSAMGELVISSSQVVQASSDAQLIRLWLHGKSRHTQRAYARDVAGLLLVVGALRQVTLGDLQDFVDGLSGSANSRKRRISAVKSLLSFGNRLGYLPVNVGAKLSVPKVKANLAERILSEEDALRLIHAPAQERDRTMLRLLYGSAARVSELCGLRWRDVQPRGETGQVTLFGKGGETRVVLLSRATWAALWGLRGEAGLDDPVFRSRKGGALGTGQVWRIVRQAGLSVGIVGVSPHWLRHSHASHALERGASVALVRDTLGHATVATTSKYLHARPGESSALFLTV